MRLSLALFVVLCISPILGALYSGIAQIQAGPSGADLFGSAVDTYADAVAVGAPQLNGAAALVGGVYMYHRHAGGPYVWGLVSTLLAPVNNVAQGYFGTSVSLAANLLAVGAPGVNFASGAAYLYTTTSPTTGPWTQITPIAALTAGGSCFYGRSLSLNAAGDYLVVGGHGCSANRGASYVYGRDTGGTNAWGIVATLTASDASAGNQAHFGYSVDIDGDNVVVGAYGDSSVCPACGSAYIFNRLSGVGWGQVRKIPGDVGDLTLHIANQYQFGEAVSISGLIVAVGSPAFNANQGAVYLFVSPSYALTQTLTPPTGTGSRFGSSVSLKGDVLVVGAEDFVSGGARAGASYVYVRTGGIFMLNQTLLATDSGLTNAYFGAAVAIGSGSTTIVVGAPGDSGTSSGKIYVVGCAPNFNGLNCETAVCPATQTVVANGVATCPTAPATVGATCTVSCNFGYVQFGSPVRTCLANATWSGIDTTCLFDCGAPTQPLQGTYSCANGTYQGQTCRFWCNAGYTLSGSSTRTCQAGGYDGTLTTCSAISCTPLSSPTNGVTSCTAGTPLGATCSTTCNTGYVLAGTAVRTCLADTTFSGTVATCPPVDCGTLTFASAANGTLTCTGTSYTSTCTVACNTGYVVVGTTVRTCQADGSWSGSVQTCGPLDCLRPGDIDHGTVSCAATTLGQTCTFACDAGYDLSGSTSRTCLPTGLYSGIKTVCTAIATPVESVIGIPVTPLNIGLTVLFFAILLLLCVLVPIIIYYCCCRKKGALDDKKKKKNANALDKSYDSADVNARFDPVGPSNSSLTEEPRFDIVSRDRTPPKGSRSRDKTPPARAASAGPQPARTSVPPKRNKATDDSDTIVADGAEMRPLDAGARGANRPAGARGDVADSRVKPPSSDRWSDSYTDGDDREALVPRRAKRSDGAAGKGPDAASPRNPAGILRGRDGVKESPALDAGRGKRGSSGDRSPARKNTTTSGDATSD